MSITNAHNVSYLASECKDLSMISIITHNQVCSTVAPFLPASPIIVEAGSFTGHDTLRLANHWPDGIIHAFEPVPSLFEKLKNATDDRTNIHCYPYALSSKTGLAEMHIAEKPNKQGIATQASSLHQAKERLQKSPIIYPKTMIVPTITLDDWSFEHKISHIDFLWLDLQGHELAALKGASRILSTVRALYTEVNFIEAYEDQPLFDEFIAWTADHGFKEIARTFKNTTDWFFGEILFVRDELGSGLKDVI